MSTSENTRKQEMNSDRLQNFSTRRSMVEPWSPLNFSNYLY